MGKTVLDVSQSTDTLTLSLGRDRNIAISRDKSKEFTKRQMLGSRVSETRHWVITVRNQKQQPVNLTLFDQVPVSNQEEIEVSDLMVSGAHLNANTGEAIWKLELKPGESRKTELSYQVKYPKGKSLVVE